MNVMFLIDSMHGGGAERNTIGLLEGLHMQGIKCYLAVLKPQGELMDSIPHGISVHSLSTSGSLMTFVASARELSKIVRRESIDIIISVLQQSNRVHMRSRFMLPDSVASIITIQNNPEVKLSQENAIIQAYKHWQTRFLYSKAEKVVAVSQGVADALMNRFAIAADKIIKIHNHVDVTKVQHKSRESVSIPWSQDDESPLLVSVGRLVPQKGFFHLLEALRQINRHRSARLIILGDGPLRSDLESTVVEYNLKDSVWMPGYVENPWAYIRKADLFVSSSLWEGFSLTHLEAMACSVPLLLTDCDYGPRELIRHNVNGCLVPVGDPEALAQEANALLDDSSRRERLARAGLDTVAAFDVNTSVERYYSLLTSLARTQPELT